MDRRTYFTIAILALLAFAGWVLVWIFRPHDEGNAFAGPPRSDYTLDNFTLDALDTDGNHSFTVAAPRLTRRGDDGSIYVMTPDYEIVDNSDNLWKGTSDSAWVNKDGSIMKLEGKVAMHRVPTEKVAPVEILTTDMTVTTDPKPKDARGRTMAGGPHRDKRMETAAPTTMIDPNNVSHSIGMKADLDLKTVELLSDVHTISLPAKSNGGK
ncbi:MAG TPA: LPS export ABC transporter periplasmic protein LptC [Rudaea sp.]|jgi:lipopolysaccharide export system protein LptC|uniref:LPS export ABC transporter periplasmic protein LptC n=1 Tax=Rudaea sp. TaxID=2136325 RepID=UPI002F91DD3B